MDSLVGRRTHDKLYLNEDRKHDVKKSFKFILKKNKLDLNNLKVLDIGCATGDFLHYLNSQFPNADLYGADIDIEKNENDSLRAWTLDYQNNRKMIINGLCMIQRFSLLKGQSKIKIEDLNILLNNSSIEIYCS